MKKPQVSVIMPSYNHAAYIQEAIDSVLSQTDVDLELLICDDCSTDDSAQVIKRQKDPRVKFSIHERNKGACTTINELISQASTDYIALINSDDIWQSTNKLSEQLVLLENQPSIGASFGKASFIDEQSNPIPIENVPFGDVFEKKNQSRAQWFRAFFENGNSICHPTMLIRRKCYTELGNYNNRYRQVPDMDMWMRLVQKYDIHISDKQWVKFRINGDQNASALTMENGIRSINEVFLITHDLLDNISSEFLIEAFPEQFSTKQKPSTVQIDIARAIPFLNVQKPALANAYKLIGLLKIKNLLSQEQHAKLLRDEYQIDDKWFQKQMGELICLTPNIAWQLQPENKRLEEENNRLEAELNQTKQYIKTQNEVITGLQKNLQQPLISLITKRLFSRAF